MIEPNALYEMSGSRRPEPGQDQQDWLRAEQRHQKLAALGAGRAGLLLGEAGDCTPAIGESTTTGARSVREILRRRLWIAW